MNAKIPTPEAAIDPANRFRAGIQNLATQLPEVAKQQAIIEQYGGELVDEFGIKPELFNSSAHTLFFSAIAQRYASLKGLTSSLQTEEYTRERDFISAATVLLAGDKSAHYYGAKHLIDADEALDPDRKRRVFDHFTNVQVTEDLRQAIDDGLLDAVKARLGITPDNEDPFEVRVLNIGDKFTPCGVTPSMPKGIRDKPWNNPEQQAWQADERAWAQYRAGLKANGIEFKKQLGMEGTLPSYAWVTNIDGARTISVLLPVAEKILYRDQPRADFYTEDDWRDDLAKLEHDYVHTQGGFALDRNLFYGASLEELRAEFFAGNRLGYQDVKGFFRDFQAVTGVDVTGYMQERPKGGKPNELYVALAKQIGLQKTLELALTLPDTYIEEARKLQMQIASYLGGRDGFTRRMYEQVLQEPQQAAEMEARLDRWAGALAAGSTDRKAWLSYRKDLAGLAFITEKLEERLERLRASRGE